MTADFLFPFQVLSRLSLAVMCLLSAAGPTLFAADAKLEAAPQSAAAEQFLKSHCLDCHQGQSAEANLDLQALTRDIASRDIEQRWVRIYDRVHAGEMPPKDAPKPSPEDKHEFLKTTAGRLTTYRQEDDRAHGRVRGRRLTRREVERSLQDLLAIDQPLADLLTEEPRSDQFSTVAERQAFSHFHLEQHLAAVDRALDEAYRRVLRGDHELDRDMSAEQVSRRDPRRRTREPEMREGLAVVWSSGLIFYGRVPATTAPEDGWYRFTVRASGLKLPKEGGVWTTVRSGLCVSSAPLLAWVTAFEATTEPRDITFDAWLPRGDMLEIRPGDVTLKRGRFQGGQVGVGEGEPQDLPGIAIERITMERIYRHPVSEVRQLLFGDLDVRRERRGDGRVNAPNPREDAARLLKAFATRAFRRPVTDAEVKPYVDTVHQALAEEENEFARALRIGYRAILCSPRFLYFTEEPGPLDDYALATRLSYFLTGATPDMPLLELAGQGRLRDKQVLRGEVDRLLAGQGARRFVADFCDEWLDLDDIDFTEPDSKLYPGFDATVENSMLDETRTFIETMLRDDLSVTQLIDSDHTFLNSRLARFYGIDGVEGDELRRVTLNEDSHRGGVLTQGAVLKVTSNGSNTSPVIRGVWVSERLLGVPIPPPPPNLPAIEPDIRGANSIRDLLAKHRSQDSCASCHVNIDPPGFALENFDPSGRWRDRYLKQSGGKRERGPVIDAGYTMPDGREFKNIDEFQSLVTAHPRKLAVNLAEKLLTYGTGAPISFADRSVVDAMTDESSKSGYGFRSILYAVVESPIFLSK